MTSQVYGIYCNSPTHLKIIFAGRQHPPSSSPNLHTCFTNSKGHFFIFRISLHFVHPGLSACATPRSPTDRSIEQSLVSKDLWSVFIWTARSAGSQLSHTRHHSKRSTLWSMNCKLIRSTLSHILSRPYRAEFAPRSVERRFKDRSVRKMKFSRNSSRRSGMRITGCICSVSTRRKLDSVPET